MPGTPVIYYGDEIGMGDNFYLGDRNGVPHPDAVEYRSQRRVFQANPQQLYLPIIIDPGISLRSDQRGKPAEESIFASVVDATRDRNAQEFQGVLTWID